MRLTRRAFVALVSALPFVKGLPGEPVQGATAQSAPPKQRYHATAGISYHAHDARPVAYASLVDLRHRKQWGGTVYLTPFVKGDYAIEELNRAKLVSLLHSTMDLAERESPDFDRTDAAVTLTIAAESVDRQYRA